MEFMDRINELCKERKISKRQLERDAGIGVGSSSKWKTFTPNNATMTKLANYFGVSISYLTGESEYRNDQEAQWAVQYDRVGRDVIQNRQDWDILRTNYDG